MCGMPVSYHPSLRIAHTVDRCLILDDDVVCLVLILAIIPLFLESTPGQARGPVPKTRKNKNNTITIY